MNERSAMKVNTDGVLLGASMTVRDTDRRLLDIGTGTGTIALMAAQRLMGKDSPIRSGNECRGLSGNEDGDGSGSVDRSRRVHEVRIDAIDIDEPSATEAAANFSNSPWSDVLHACNVSLDGYAARIAGPDASYDLIFSNPPYFEESLQAPQERRNNARHTATGLSYREILDFASERLTEQGRVSLVLPADVETALTRHARMCGLHLFRILRVRTVPRKDPSRIIAEFSRTRCRMPEEELLTIQNEGKYTQEYLSLTRDFYLFA
ncbi:MAG: methyltransferase [Bacteroidales bacterium]|nr:methyltransferase [Bacteroidales bacterium]